MSRQEGLIELPNGQCIFYDDAAHAYYRARRVVNGNPNTATSGPEPTYRWVRSTRLTGASTLCKPYSFDSGRLLAWKERMTCEGVAERFHRDADLQWLYTGESIRAALKEAALTADDVRDRKADVGTRAHGVLEALAAGESPEAQDGYGQAVINWWRERKPTVLNCEQFIYHAELGYAGRLDLRCRVGDEVWIVDAKTSGWLAPSVHVQLQLYRMGAVACGVGDADRLVLLQLRDDGTYREVPVRATEEDARSCVAVYRGAGRIERESGLPKAKAA